MEKIAHFVYTRSKLIIAIVIILNITAAISFYRFNIDTDFIKIFSEGNPKAQEFVQLEDKYQSGEVVTVLIEHDESFLDKQNLISVLQIQGEIRAIYGIIETQSFVPPQISLGDNTIPVNEQFINTNYPLLRDFIENRYYLTSQFLSANERMCIITIIMDPKAAPQDVVDSLKEITDDSTNFNMSLAGNVIIRDTLRSYMLKVLSIIAPCAILLILLVFITILRHYKLAILSIIPAGIGSLWTFGTMFWSSQELSVVTIISPIFVMVIGAADGLHYTSHFIENMSEYTDRKKLTSETLRMVGMPIFLTSITTMAGFASLTWSDVLPLRQMGIFVTAGIGYAGAVSLFFLPAVISRIKLPTKLLDVKQSRLNRMILAVSRQRVAIIIVFLAILGVSAFYIPRIEVVSDQLMFFKEDTDIQKTFATIEEHFGGALVLTGDIVSVQGQLDLMDHEYASKVLAVERELETLPGIAGASSVFDFIQGMNNMVTGYNTYPENLALIQALLSELGTQDLASWVSSDGFKMVIKTQDMDSADIERLNEFVEQNQETIRIITGLPVLFNEVNNLVVKSQFQSLGLALALIFLILWGALRRYVIALIGLLPIAITVTVILGMLVLTGFNLNMMTATFSAIVIGVGVDYSIHLLSGILYFQREGLNKVEAVKAALSSVSRPILANAFGLAIGLSALFFSPLQLHSQVASIMWVAMVVSSLATLLLIPLFYSGGERRPKKPMD